MSLQKPVIFKIKYGKMHGGANVEGNASVSVDRLEGSITKLNIMQNSMIIRGDDESLYSATFTDINYFRQFKNGQRVTFRPNTRNPYINKAEDVQLVNVDAAAAERAANLEFIRKEQKEREKINRIRNQTLDKFDEGWKGLKDKYDGMEVLLSTAGTKTCKMYIFNLPGNKNIHLTLLPESTWCNHITFHFSGVANKHNNSENHVKMIPLNKKELINRMAHESGLNEACIKQMVIDLESLG